MCVCVSADIRWCSEEAMGSCLSCPEKESIPDNHQSKFKVSDDVTVDCSLMKLSLLTMKHLELTCHTSSEFTPHVLAQCVCVCVCVCVRACVCPPIQVINVDDDGNELGSGVMELTDAELVLHTHRRDDVRWPYLCLRRYGYDSNLFSFESGRRCQTGQGTF